MTEGKVILSDLKRWFGKSMRIVVPIACSAALLCWLFSKVHFGDITDVLRQGVKFEWILLMLVFNTLSYAIRGIRWGLQLDGVGVHASRWELVVSIFGAYALNLLFTGFGEAWRCVFISRRQKVSLSTVVGTDIGDRSSDAVAVILILLLSLLVARGPIDAFLSHYALGRDVERFADNPWMWGGIAMVVFVVWSAWHFLKRYPLMDKVEGCFDRIWLGFKVLFTMKHKWWYAWLTLGIWACYFMQTYVCFFAFPFTKALITPALCYGLLPGLVALLFGSMSMGIPSSGGLGPWNLAIMFALSIYGINNTEGAAFALLLWSCEALLQVMLGLFTIAYVTKTSK